MVKAARALVAGLSVVVLTVAVLQTAVVPVLGIIADQLDASTVAVSWAVTANLLAAAAATPLIGRLADLHSKKRVLLIVLAVVLVGSVLAATTSSLALLIVGRVLQAASFALYPIGISILREELTEDRMVSAMSVLSGTLGFGGGTGLVVVGLLMQSRRRLPPRLLADDRLHHRRDRHRGARRACATAQLDGDHRLAGCRRPRDRSLGDAVGDHPGQVLGLDLTMDPGLRGKRRRRHGRLVAVGAPGQTAAGVDQMLTRRPIMLTNLATIFVGMGLYFAFLGLTQFVQIPHEAAGYGFGATVLEASVIYLLPGALTGFLVALISGRFIDRFGARPVLVVAAAAGITGFLFIALAHSAPWQVIAASILANAYISLGYGALPALVVSEVEAGETGVATSMNAIARTIGSSTAAALVAVLLGRTVTGTSVPMESSFVVIFVGGALTAALAMVLIALSRVQARGIDTVEARYESRAMNHEWG